MSKPFTPGEKVEVTFPSSRTIPGIIDFVCGELGVMSILIGTGCHKSEDTKLMVYSSCEKTRGIKVSHGWSDSELAQKALTPRPCTWYDSQVR